MTDLRRSNGAGLALILFLLVGSISGRAQNSEELENSRKAADKEEARFQKSLRKDKDTSAAYFAHAVRLSELPTESPRADGFFQLALKHDSASPATYKEYGSYLSNISHKYYDARQLLEKALSMTPSDDDCVQRLKAVNAIIEARVQDSLLYDFGRSSLKTLNPNPTDSSVTRFDSLRKALAIPDNVYSYFTLLPRFLSGDTTLTADKMYLLMVGYTLQPDYNPFNYNDINEMKMIAGHSLDRAIARGKEVEKTNPLNPALNREMMYYYRKKNMLAEAATYQYRVQLFFKGMLFSGNGTCDFPYVSLWAKEEYSFLTYLGYKSTGNHAMGNCRGQMAELVDAISPDTHQPGLISFDVALIFMKSVGK